MWMLSSDGKALEGKLLWLRPGTSHLLGRTSNKIPTGQQTYIPHDSISRKHLILHIADVKSGDVVHVHSRSVITATESSSRGTVINGKKYKGQLITFDPTQTEYIIHLASSPEKLKIEWKPVVLAVVGLTKAEKKEGTPMAMMKDKLQQADIKFLQEYLPNESTHVIGKSRNTPAALQALLQAKWLLSESFIGALSSACSSRVGENTASPLEDDFENSWPWETEYILPFGTERVARPNHYLEPDPERAQLFKDHTFIFLSKSQFEKLLPVVAAGGGKALLCESPGGEPTAARVITFIKEVAGKTDSRRFLLSQESGPGIVLVGRAVSDDSRADELAEEIEGALNQCMINQKAFLDVILTKDVSSFRRQPRNVAQDLKDDEMEDVPVASSGSIRPATMRSERTSAQSSYDVTDISHPPDRRTQPPLRSSQQPSRIQERPEEVAPEQLTTRRRRRIITTQSHAKFGDDYDPGQIIRATSDSPEPAQAPPGNAPIVRSGDADKDALPNVTTDQNTRKRPAPVESDDDIEETTDQKHDRMFPNAAALKRQKIEETKTGFKSFPKPKSESYPKQSDSVKIDVKAKKGKRKVLEPEPEIKEKLQARVKFDEEQRLDEEAKADMSTMTNEDLKQIAEEHKDKMIVTFEVLALERPQRGLTETNVDHPEWKGRQNYKKFRSNKVHDRHQANPRERNKKQSEDHETQRRIINLVPVPRKERGIGDDYWLSRQFDQNKSQQSQSQSQQQDPGLTSRAASSAVHRQAAAAAGEVDVDDEEDDAHAFRRRIQRSREEDMENEAAHHALDESIRGSVSKNASGSNEMLRNDTTQQKASGKRPATESNAGVEKCPPAKRARQTKTSTTAGRRPIGSRSGLAARSDDEDDPTAFRRTRR